MVCGGQRISSKSASATTNYLTSFHSGLVAAIMANSFHSWPCFRVSVPRKGERIVRKAPLLIAAVALLLGIVCVGFAQAELKPVDIVSFAHYDRLKEDVTLIGRLAGQPDLADKLESMLTSTAQSKGLPGLDTKRPWGVAYLTDGGPMPAIYAFVPVTDLKPLMEAAKSDPRLAAAIKLDNDVYVIEGSGMPLFVQQKGTWAVITNARNNRPTAGRPAETAR